LRPKSRPAAVNSKGAGLSRCVSFLKAVVPVLCPVIFVITAVEYEALSADGEETFSGPNCGSEPILQRCGNRDTDAHWDSYLPV
jgi:hypothetical protein